VLESYDDHSNFLRTRERYRFLFDYEVTDYKNWAHGLKKAGYATNPEYANKLIRIIEENSLSQYDLNGKAVAVSRPGPSTSTTTATAVAHPTEKKTMSNSSATIVNNNVKYVVAKKGDSYLSIAQQEDVMLWELLKYNDADKGTSVTEGEIVYLKPKRNKASTGFHTIKEGETLRSISQLYGIKLKSLAKRNHLSAYTDPPAGTKLSLN
jgi:LysM repeat protein